VPALPPIDLHPELVAAFWRGFDSGFSVASTENREAYFALMAEREAEQAARWSAYHALDWDRLRTSGLLDGPPDLGGWGGYSDSPFDDHRD
jgi:hypothetical protein